MKNIAFWSRDHMIAARLLIAFCHILIFCIACYVGIGLKTNNIVIPATVFWIFVTIFLSIAFLFSNSYHSFSFYRKKILDGVILISGFVMIICFVNQKNLNNVSSYNTLRGSFSQKNPKAIDPKSKPSIKELKKQLKQLKKAAKDEGASTGGIILAILVAAMLGIALAAASCSVACNGQDALAILLFIGGVTAIFFISRAIIRGTRKKSMDKVTPAPDVPVTPAMQ